MSTINATKPANETQSGGAIRIFFGERSLTAAGKFLLF